MGRTAGGPVKYQDSLRHCMTGAPRKKLTPNCSPISVKGWSAQPSRAFAEVNRLLLEFPLPQSPATMETAALHSLRERQTLGVWVQWHRALDLRAPRKLCRSEDPHLPPGAARPVWTGRLQLITLGNSTPEQDLLLPPFFFPLRFTLHLGE